MECTPIGDGDGDKAGDGSGGAAVAGDAATHAAIGPAHRSVTTDVVSRRRRRRRWDGLPAGMGAMGADCRPGR